MLHCYTLSKIWFGVFIIFSEEIKYLTVPNIAVQTRRMIHDASDLKNRKKKKLTTEQAQLSASKHC